MQNELYTSCGRQMHFSDLLLHASENRCVKMFIYRIVTSKGRVLISIHNTNACLCNDITNQQLFKNDLIGQSCFDDLIMRHLQCNETTY
jgi:hypothetical protein